MATIGENVKYYRERANMSHEELAEQIETSPEMLIKFESGELIPNHATLFRIAVALDIPISKLTDTSVYFMEV